MNHLTQSSSLVIDSIPCWVVWLTSGILTQQAVGIIISCQLTLKDFFEGLRVRWRLVVVDLRVKSDSTVFLYFFGKSRDHFLLFKSGIVKTNHMVTSWCSQHLLTSSLPASTVVRRGSNLKSPMITLVRVPILYLLHRIHLSDYFVYFIIRFRIKEPCFLMWR